MFKKLLILSTFMSFISLTSQAQQKFGHMNSGNIMELMPEVKLADAKLAVLDDSLGVVLDTMMAQFRHNYNTALKSVNEGTMSKLQQAEVEKQLNDDQTKINDFQKMAQVMIGQRRQSLLEPVINKLNTVIVEVGKENGYSFIFDVSSGSMLYVTESDDVSTLVAAKLGLTLPK